MSFAKNKLLTYTKDALRDAGQVFFKALFL